jgi:hypothetical protein
MRNAAVKFSIFSRCGEVKKKGLHTGTCFIPFLKRAREATAIGHLRITCRQELQPKTYVPLDALFVSCSTRGEVKKQGLHTDEVFLYPRGRPANMAFVNSYFTSTAIGRNNHTSSVGLIR